MGVLLEILAFFLLFLVFRQAVVKAFPVKAIGMSLSGDSKKALKKYRTRYLILFWLSAIVFTLLLLLCIHFVFYMVHSMGSYNEVLILDYSSLFLPSLIMGFLGATFFARSVNAKLQLDGLSFFFEGYQDEVEGFERNKLKAWHIIIALSFSMVMLFLQFNSYLKTDDEYLYYQENTLSKPLKYSKQEIVQISLDSANFYQITFKDAESITTKRFNGDLQAFVRDLTK